MPAGRPLKFQSVEELERKIDEYFTTVDESEWTWTWLALFLDTDRSVLQDYREKEEFSYPLKKALQRVEASYEKDLKKTWRTWTIFALKNFGWKDKQEIDQTNVNADVTERLTDEQKATLAQRFIKTQDGK